jgi:predicted HAD superfamily phosphohydrolase YqeG
MFDDAVKKFDLNESECIIIGDKLSDVMMGERSSCKKILIESQYTSEVDWEGILLTHKIIRKKDLLDACNHILESSS